MKTKREQIEEVKQKAEALLPVLHEKARRRWAACEARALGYGGISIVAEATGLSRPTIRRGLADLDDHHLCTTAEPDVADEDDSARIRRPGAGRPPSSLADPTLVDALQRLIEPTTRGDPM